jgi:hypothetical protein
LCTKASKKRNDFLPMAPLNVGFLQQTMTLMQRRSTPGVGSANGIEDNKKVQAKTPFTRNSAAYAILAFFFFVGLILNRSASPTLVDGSISSSSSGSLGLVIEPGAEVVIKFDKNESGEVSLGPHRLSLVVEKSCNNPSVWMRLEGDSLVVVNLLEDSSSPTWSGSFSLPIEGRYQVVAYWYGCNGNGADVSTLKLHSFSAKGASAADTAALEESPSLFPHSAWISSSKFQRTESVSQPYIWLDPNLAPQSASLSKISSSVFSMESTAGGNKFYSFSELSNYEIVCFVGSESSNKIFKSFMEIRPMINQHQRPFKFHYHRITSFVNPDQEWNEEEKTRFRKCKQIFVSLDEMQEPISQDEYIRQVKEFIDHLTKAFPDTTFPIWMFTVMQSPTKSSNCHTPTLPRTSDHPCNDVLKGLFQEGSFPERVHLLDNTDISLPHLGENSDDITAVVALRMFVLVGKRVKEWREKGQIGTIKGLVRGDETEPNFELVPYTGWN